jgi:hypothetical protein
MPALALAAIKKLDKGGDTANTLTASDRTAINDYVTAARAGNTASKGGLGGGTGTAGNIALQVLIEIDHKVEQHCKLTL